MVLNSVYSDEDTVEMVIHDNLVNLCSELAKEGLNVVPTDFEYSFFQRVEKLALPSSRVYPNEDIPRMFGVQRGYNGGGIHADLIQTEIYKMTEKRQARAERRLQLIKKAFWQILHDMDHRDEEVSGEKKQAWEQLTL